MRPVKQRFVAHQGHLSLSDFTPFSLGANIPRNLTTIYGVVDETNTSRMMEKPHSAVVTHLFGYNSAAI